MNKVLKYFFIFFAINSIYFSQNQTAKWYFGAGAGLDFMTVPPSILSNGSMTVQEGCASVSDASGNLLFYSDGMTVWNQNHAVMLNGTGLSGAPTVFMCQPVIILKKPNSSTQYYVFTHGVNTGVYYSIVDMSLAAGLGSVTVLSVPITPGIFTTERLTATKHCNGIDYWILSHDQNSNTFRANLLTATGVSTLSVISNVGFVQTTSTAYQGYLRISPNGKRIAMAIGHFGGGFEVFDFDNTTAIVSNPIPLLGITNTAYGCEFSPSGTLLYGCSSSRVYQWDLCAGASIASTQFTVVNSGASAMQLAPNGKIYLTHSGGSSLSVINTPNGNGASCGFISAVQSVSPQLLNDGLPNFISNYFFPLPSPFTYTCNMAVSCNTATFTSPSGIAAANALCSSAGSTVSSIQWNFGDVSSGPANTSTLSNPIHIYPGPGTYSAQLIINYQCRADTLKQLVLITSPTITVISSSVSCNSLSSATVTTLGGSGPYSYTWSPGSQTTAIANNLSAGLYSVTMLDNGGGCTGTHTLSITTPSLISGSVNSLSLACNGIATGTAWISITNGSGSYSYLWSPSAQTSSIVSSLAAGIHTVLVSDLLNLCSISNTFLVTQPPALTLNITASSATACVATNIVLTGSNSGGTGPYSYNWGSGPATNSFTITQASGANYTYSLNSTDANSCSVSNTISVSFVNTPTLSVSNVTICPLQIGTLTASGASSYTWLPSNTVGVSFTQSPVSSTQFTVVGSQQSCTSMATASIVVKAVPIPTLSSNSPLCNNQSLSLSAIGGTAYVWAGPLSFSSALQNPILNPVTPNHSGLYTTTLTAANSCTAAASVSVTVNPTPTLSVFGSTLCSNQSMSLSAYSFAGSTYTWSGPNAFNSNAQFPILTNPSANLSGAYQVTVSSAQNCTNTGIANVTITTLPSVSITANTPLCFGTTLLLSGSGGLNYNWMGPNAFSSSLQNPSISAISFNHAGTYTLIATTGPCTVPALKTITVNPLPIPTAGYNVPLCNLKTLYLAASPAQTYTWSGPQNFYSNVQSPSLASVSFSNAGQYSLSVTDANACVGNTVVLVNVLANPIASANGATVCLGGNVSLNASGGIAYNWSGPGGFTSNLQSLYFQNITSSQSGAYTVVVTGSNSCSSSTVVMLNGFNYNLPTPTIIATPSVCVNSSISLQGSGGVSYSWEGPGNFTSSSSNITFLATHTGMTGTYTLTVINSSYCAGSGTTYVQVFPLPNGTLSSSLNELCVPFCSEFKVTANSSSAPLQTYQYFIEGHSFQTPKANYCISQAGGQTVFAYYTDIHNCANSSTINISAYPKPAADFEFFPIKPIAGIDPVHFTNRSLGLQQSEWTWVFANGDSILNEQANFLFEQAGKFPVVLVVKNNWSCADTIIKVVTVEEDFALFVPNTFTPNNDDLNEIFRPQGQGIKDYHLEIYNRWGDLIFKTEDFQQGWDGYYKGELCKPGVYTWKILYTQLSGKAMERSGYVMLGR